MIFVKGTLFMRLLLAQGQGFDHPFAMGSNYVWFTFDGGKDTFNGKM